jgi:hypothetical protein
MDSLSIYNNSNQLMIAKLIKFAPGIDPVKINPGSHKKWQIDNQTVVRIDACGFFHEFKLSPGSVVRLNPDLFLEIVDGSNSFKWNARDDGPKVDDKDCCVM